jgi:hypothetical protein
LRALKRFKLDLKDHTARQREDTFEMKLSSGKKESGELDSPFATLLLIALPDFVIAVIVIGSSTNT